MNGHNLGGNHFTFTGENTTITYDTQTPGPLTPGTSASGGQLQYQGVEGDRTFHGNEITLQETALGTLITVTLKLDNDSGGLNFTILLPHIMVTHDQAQSFQTLGIKTATRGFIVRDGQEETYSVFPLLGSVETLITPL